MISTVLSRSRQHVTHSGHGLTVPFAGRQRAFTTLSSKGTDCQSLSKKDTALKIGALVLGACLAIKAGINIENENEKERIAFLKENGGVGPKNADDSFYHHRRRSDLKHERIIARTKDGFMGGMMGLLVASVIPKSGSELHTLARGAARKIPVCAAIAAPLAIPLTIAIAIDEIDSKSKTSPSALPPQKI